jgi:hypothetical protein
LVFKPEILDIIKHTSFYGYIGKFSKNFNCSLYDEHGHRKMWKNKLILPRIVRQRGWSSSLFLAELLKGLLPTTNRRELCYHQKSSNSPTPLCHN